jgi:2'-hydroxyisoflavone reductase
VQFIDARDLATWTLGMVTRRDPGVFNVTGPSEPYRMEDLLNECAGTTQSDADFIWVDPDFLLERKVEPWSELPLWLPTDNGMLQTDVGRAKTSGLRLRPVHDTVRDVLDWTTSVDELPGDAGMDRAREAQILDEWRLAS